MALPPTIPTSFVPRQPVDTRSRRMKSGTNIFMIIGVAALVISLLASAGAFATQKYLEGVAAAKSASLTALENSTDSSSVQDFIRLRNRLSAAESLLNKHVELSQFFTVLEAVTLQNVQFSSLKVVVDDDRTATITMNGTAKTFNALAAESSAFAAQKGIKRAIFSNISAAKTGGGITFDLTADLDQSLVVAPGISSSGSASPSTPVNAPVVVPVSTSSASTTTP